MANDGQIVFEVTADGKHAIADIKDITKAIQQETGKWDTAAKQSTDKISGSFSSMLTKLAAGFSVAKIGQSLLNLGKDAVNAASDLQEVQNVVDVTFGENANQIEKWAKNAGTQFGLTETQAKKFSSTMGAMLKSSGLAGEKIVDVSTDLAGLAADMASFYNLDFEEAFSKIRSGISGQTMPLKELGIDMSVATLNAFALKQGLTKTFNEMDQGEQTMLRYQYLMQATADAQGDFSRTSDGYANSVRKLETNIEQLKTTLGASFLDIVAEAVGALNGFIELLLPDESKRTVLDDFADIDLKTETKLEQIRQTAEEARLLTDELDAIGGSKTDKAGSKVQKLADDLSNINLDQGKAGIVKEFISTLAENIGIISGIQDTDAEGAQKWLENIAASADSLDPEDAKGWETLLNTIKEGLPGIENTDFGAAFFAALGEGFSSVSEQSSVLQWAVDSLGNKTNKTAQEQALWLETCKRLVKTIPGLSSIINTETGEVKGGTDAVKEYIKAWEDGQKKLAMMNALQEKENALASRFSNLPELELNMALDEKKVRDNKKKIDEILNKYGIGKEGSTATVLDMTAEDQDLYEKLADNQETLEIAAEQSREAYTLQADALKEAEIALKEYNELVEEMPGDIDNTTEALEKNMSTLERAASGDEEAVKTVTDAVNAANEALKDMADYAKNAYDNALQALNSTASGLNRVDYQAYGKQIEKISELTEKQSKYKVGSDEWKKLQTEIDNANKSLVSTNNIYKDLESQEQFLDDYLANLKKAREMGLSDALLSELSDGSVESAEQLSAIVNDKTGKSAEEIDKKYQEIQQKKATLAQELSDQQLTVDQTYQGLVDKAKQAISELDLGEEAKNSASDTIKGIAEGINGQSDAVKTAVDGIIDQLDRLNGYGINIDFGGFGNITFTTSTGKTEGSGRMGIPLVPHDDYIARLHEGERVLTAQENQIWNALRNGGVSGFDLETLGGVMRDNVKAGGNVYLDGRVVGNVISDQQGKSYRQLQRSGWQA